MATPPVRIKCSGSPACRRRCGAWLSWQGRRRGGDLALDFCSSFSPASRRRRLQRRREEGGSCAGASDVGLVWLMAGWSGVYSALDLWSAAGGSASASRLRRRERPDPKVGCELGVDPRPACHSDRWAPLVLLLVVLKAVLAMKLLQPWVCGSLLSPLVLLAGAGDDWVAAPALLGKTHVPDFEWKIHDFSALLETKATTAISGPFDCSGHKWCLQVSPMHKKNGDETPYVALCLKLYPYMLEQDHPVHGVFEFSIYNHSNRMYYGCKADYNFGLKNSYSEKECLIPLQELLKSSAFLVDDSCVFGVKILKIDVSSPEKKVVVIQNKATVVRNLFVQKKGFTKGTYTWTMSNFLELDLKEVFRSCTFEVAGHKWYVMMYPRGVKCSTDSLSLFLCLDSSNELPLDSRNVVVMTLSIQDQKNGNHVTRTAGLAEFTSGWGWVDFIPLKKFKDPSGGYLVESKCVVKADFTIVGSSNDG